MWKVLKEWLIKLAETKWSNFECDIRSEIKYLEFIEQHVDYSSSETSKRSSPASKKSDKSKISSIGHVEEDRFQLQKEEAALKAKLAYVEKERILRLEHRKTELTKLEQEIKLEELRIQSELAQNQAKLNVCMSAEKEGLEFRCSSSVLHQYGGTKCCKTAYDKTPSTKIP